ncbi:MULTISPECIES: copper amine oxidase N-terminal domain-containing protein [Paenibacillus]|uniref:Copper amine oxidase N-terminal domain-containing protein n=1 Tax=Paenibacillus validus TaxID=44253 RepID=A0A7X3CS27_9BACL|nr:MULTISPECIES: copper amine oxidase N-terminal domain-containing protein [Paenibacillus]MUG71350.1 copper amine oxidase N-terminal domain-containing protein [Paenibacillus validus]
MRRMKQELALLLVFTLLLGTFGFSASAADKKESSVSSGTTYVLLYLNKAEAFLNGEQVTLDAPATIIKDKMFVPAKFLGDAFGMKVEWNEQTRMIEMETPNAQILLDSDNKSVWINGYWMRFEDAAAIVNGRLMVKLTWLADYMGARYTYNDELKRVEVLYVKTPQGIYIPDTGNSKPVAKFSFGKSVYKIGEPIKYVDLSYDPDAEGIAKFDWKGRQEAIFTPGTYPVTLTVEDIHGNRSEPYTRYLVIGKETYLNEVEYPIYRSPVGSFIKTNWSVLWSNFHELPELPKQVTEDKSRKLLVSDSPETFEQQGILYQDTIEGKGRLYADHINGTNEKVTMAILAKNMTDKPVTVRTTNKGEVWPSVYANLIGNEATVDFLLGDPLNEKLTIPPNQTFVYKQMPDFYPGQGVNLFYDVETDGLVQFSFIASSQISQNSLTLPLLPFNGHVRGSFPVSEVQWNIDATTFTSPSRLIVGDGKIDPFQPGYDTIRMQQVNNDGNYGVVYKIHADKPRKMAVMILPKGGVFKGPFKINGEIRLVPESGVITAFDGMQILAKTTGTEEALDIEFSPPAGSAFPIDLIFYPLDERETK